MKPLSCRIALAALVLIIAIPAGVCQTDAPEEGLLFHASFDKRDVTADFARGNPHSTTFTESLELRGVPGVSGPAFQIAADERLDYELPGNLDSTRGSISMWIMPVNWQGRNDRFEVFFAVRGAGMSMNLYKYSQPNMVTIYIATSREHKVLARNSADDWKPEQWHHLVATWDQSRVQLYVDSELAQERDLPEGMVLPALEDGWFTITPPKLWEQGFDPDDRTVADEVKIYDRVLSAAEVRREYLRLAPEQAEAGPLDLQFKIDSANRSVRVMLDAFGSIEKLGQEVTAQVTLSAEGGDIIAQQDVALEEGAGAADLEFGDLAPGRYVLRAEVRGAGEETVSAEATFERPATPWTEPLPQYDHAVPDPWTPVEGDASELRVWGRAYSFGDGPLPTAITSQERATLAGPVALMVDTGDGPREPQWSAAEVAERHPDLIARSGSGTAGDVDLTWRTAVEFDGMLRCDLEVRPRGERATLQGLRLVVPVASEAGEYVLAPVLEDFEEGRIELPFRDMVWLTGHDVGLCWFTESEANWVYEVGRRPITIERADGVTTLTVAMISRAQEITGPVRYTFGLQATPLRPLPERWRNFNMGGAKQVPSSRAQIAAQGGGCFKFNASLEARDGVDMEAVRQRWQDFGVSLPYSTPTYLADHNAVHDFHQLEWRNSYRHSYVGYKMPGVEGEYALRATCPASDFSDLMVYWVHHLFEDYPWMGGIYYDCCSASACKNHRHGCGGTDAFGRSYETRPIFALREVLKRVFTILHAHGKVLVNHSHSRFYPPLHSFSDYWFPGEQYATKVGRTLYYYTDEMPLAEWQIELNSHIRGVGSQFLPQYGRGTDKKFRDEETAPTRSVLAACVVHDVPCSASWVNYGEIEKLWQVYDAYKLSRARFHAYWRDCPAQASEPLTASVYELDGAAVIAVANLTPEPASGTVSLDVAALGLEGPLIFRLEPGGEAIPGATADAIPISLPARDYAMIAVTEQ